MKKKYFRPKKTVLAAESPIESLLDIDIHLPSGRIVKKRVNDIYYLFQSERLAKSVGVDTINSWLASLGTDKRSVIDSLNLSDEQLFSFIKSRNIQSPSELLMWSEYLKSTYKEEVAEIERAQMSEVDVAPIDNSSETSKSD